MLIEGESNVSSESDTIKQLGGGPVTKLDYSAQVIS